jgi:TatA/E family protein of Tat protein translocase
MSFMGMGPLEILLILVLGFLFFGPEKLPQMAAKAGRLYRNFKKATFDLSKSISSEIESDEKTIRDDLAEIGRSFTREFSGETDRKKEKKDEAHVTCGEQTNGETSVTPVSPASEDK